MKFSVQTNVEQFRVIENKENLPWRTYVGVCGMPGASWVTRELCQLRKILTKPFSSGKTAYMGWKEIAQAKKVQLLVLNTSIP